MTGKGDRWGRDSVGRSAPAFLAASTTALPPPTCTARREAGRHHLWPLFLLRGRPTAGCWFLRPVPGGESAGCVCLQRPCSAGLFVCLLPILPAMPTALNVLAPVQSFCFVFAPVHSMCARIGNHPTNMFASCETVPLAAATRACSGGPCAGSIVDF